MIGVTGTPAWHTTCRRLVEFVPHPSSATSHITMSLREFTDASGRQWSAWDVRPGSSLDGGTAARSSGGYDIQPWLAFECATTGERRRLTPIPAGWSSASDTELRSFCVRAQKLSPRKRLIE